MQTTRQTAGKPPLNAPALEARLGFDDVFRQRGELVKLRERNYVGPRLGRHPLERRGVEARARGALRAAADDEVEQLGCEA
jgi:hypothetical protein